MLLRMDLLWTVNLSLADIDRLQDHWSQLLIDEGPAKQVRRMFSRYLELGSVFALTRALNMAASGGTEKPIHSRGKIYHLLANPIYIGKIRHQGQLYDGEHQAIIDTETFERVQRLLADQAVNPRGGAVHADNHPLTGRIYDEHGKRLTPVHATNHEKRYRYYVSDHKRLIGKPGIKQLEDCRRGLRADRRRPNSSGS